MCPLSDSHKNYGTRCAQKCPSERILALWCMAKREYEDDTLHHHQGKEKMVAASLSKTEGKHQDGVHMLEGKDGIHQKKKKKVPTQFSKAEGEHKRAIHQCLYFQRVSQSAPSPLVNAFR